jgi:tetratricopeptide (TPR) repeat protein
MKRSIFFLVLILIFPVLAFADAEKIFQENSKAVVVVVTLDEKGEPMGQGSGFIVRPDGAIVTNYHVISDAKDIKVKIGEKILDIEGLIHADKENDLVILKAKGENLPTVKLGDLEKAHIGEKIYVISSPKGMENTISDGLLSGIREIDEKRKILQITAPVSPGSSGGPVFNNNGEVIGIATFLLEEAQNLNFAMPVNLVKDNLRERKTSALKKFKIEDYKKSEEYWLNRGHYFFEMESYEKAIEAFRQAITINPNSANTYFNIGAANFNLKKYDEAIEVYKQSIRLDPDDAQIYISLGNAYDRLNNHEKASDAYKEAIKIAPDDYKAHYRLAGIKLFRDDLLSKSEYEQSIKLCKRAIRLNPEEVEALLFLGKSYSGLDSAQFNLHMEQVLKIGMYYPPRYPEHKKDELEAYKQAIILKPNYSEAHYELGLFYLYDLENKALALEEYKILKDLDKELADNLFNLIYK